jgi:hypothetical protein
MSHSGETRMRYFKRTDAKREIGIAYTRIIPNHWSLCIMMWNHYMVFGGKC